MASVEGDGTTPAVRFKRRKIAHPKRVYAEDDALTTSESQAPDAGTRTDNAPTPPAEPQDQDNSVPNLRDIIRNRKRPRDRLRDVLRKADTPRTELVPIEAPREGLYTSRFVAQTGQVVDRDDKQMTKFVEARLAEQNFRQYGWPIPPHLRATVAEIAPDLRNTITTSSSQSGPSAETQSPANIEHSIRIAAGMGKIEEVDIAPVPKRTDEKWRRLENGEFEHVATGKVRLGRDGKPRRPPKRRNSDDVRRDQMVEAVLSEAKLDYFDAQAYANLRTPASANNDDAFLAQFQADYYESVEDARQQQRKPAPAAAKDAPKGPKLGGSKSARAKMRLAEEQAAKTKR
ncbi:hypothetical protein HBI56_025400 [Parastagonospora nodorum]|nr:hypothetical protein HBH53_033780 [Parastagonospora nodorum]KAH3990130.1 hypothetical protein HBH52_010790 [Parastagonospora nodorum]KAH4006986.1 hypothetical protein HBI10_021210 [Parastagonospora nodorum]KAH4008514.1 hypothetical protein HBI13_234870 [Parastagonospora nodorum]KAH4100604.1 hypothetical protein HBH46_148890 [Parastagonospora nodorum]